ncbi:hypothetical protein CAP39_10180 [Sphingomonas sp. IBVSS1]|nr:hypothetical protein CAP39_10180 [Sphingomonas sp. IBVSS1]
MAKFADASVLDAALAVVAGATRLVVTNGQPADVATADAARLAEATLGPGDFTLGTSAGGGRRLAVAGKAGLVALANGTADHVALIDDGAGRVLQVTTCPPAAVLAGVALNVAGWDFVIGAPL